MNQESKPPPIPQAVAKAPPITEEEFLRIRKQNRLMWLFTMLAVPLSFMMTAQSLGFGLVINAILLGLALHAAARLIWKDGSKVGSMRYQKYKNSYEVTKLRKKASTDESKP